MIPCFSYRGDDSGEITASCQATPGRETRLAAVLQPPVSARRIRRYSAKIRT